MLTFLPLACGKDNPSSADAAAPPGDGAVFASSFDAGSSAADGAEARTCEILTGAVPGSAYRRKAGAGVPRRLVIFYTPLGTSPAAWRPSGGETDFTLGTILQPLEPYRSRLLVLDGIDNVVAPGVPATTAASGASVLLTGHPGFGASSAQGPFVCGGATSIDVVLGGNDWPVPSLRLGIAVTAGSPLVGPLLPSFASSGQALLPENDPRAAALALGLAAPTPVDPLDVPSTMQAQLKLAVEALAKNKTPTVIISFGSVASRSTFPWLGVNAAYADFARSSDPMARAWVTKVQTWFAQSVASLAQMMDAVPEGNGTLLDDSLVVWVSETGDAAAGTGSNIPVVLIGGAGGALQTGRFLRFPAGYTQADLFATIGALMEVPGFGDPALKPRALPGL